MPEEEKIEIPADHVLKIMQQLYPAEFGHALATAEALYWKARALSQPETE